MKTSDLMGAALDWAVAKCEGGDGLWYDTIATHWIKINGKDRALSKGWAQSFTPSTDWAQGGPIIEREKMTIEYGYGLKSDQYLVSTFKSGCPYMFKRHNGDGPTLLIAAMRCYVTSKLGDNVEVPDELAVQVR